MPLLELQKLTKCFGGLTAVNELDLSIEKGGIVSETDPIYKQLAARLGLENSKYMPRILARLANLGQARIVAELPSPPERHSAAKKLRRDE